jgi:uncharacterized membrane protein
MAKTRKPSDRIINMEQAESTSWNRTRWRAVHIASWGHAAFAASMIVLGIWGLVKGDFTPIWLPVPKGAPAREALANLCALVSLGSGIGLLWQRAAAVACRVLLGFLLAWLLLVNGTYLFRLPGMQLTWAAAQTVALLAAAWVLYVWFAGERDAQRLGFVAGDGGLRIARALYGLSSIVFGMAHFTYSERTIAMVPGWIPGHVFWAYFTGCAFVAAGVAMIVGVYARLAAVLSVVQLAMFALLVWAPVAMAGPDAGQLSEIVVTVVLTAAAWVVADSYRGLPWLAVGKRATRSWRPST